MSDTPIIKGKPKNAASEEVIPETTESVAAEKMEEKSFSIAGLGQPDPQAQKNFFAQGIYMEFLRARADHGFFNLATMPRQTGQKMLIDELVHLRGVAEVAAEVWFKNK